MFTKMLNCCNCMSGKKKKVLVCVCVCVYIKLKHISQQKFYYIKKIQTMISQ